MNTSFQYDRTGRLTGKQTKRLGAGILPDIILNCNYSYDEHGRTRSKQTASGTLYYYYDAEYRLTEVRIDILNATAISTMHLAGASKNTGWTGTASHATAPPSCGTGCR